MKQRRSAIGFAAALATVLVVSLFAYRGLLPSWLGASHLDKLLHFAMAGVLAYFLDGAVRQRRAWRGTFAPPLASVLLLVPVGIEEFCQRFSYTRTSSVWDFAADVAGVAAFIALARARTPVPRSSEPSCRA